MNTTESLRQAAQLPLWLAKIREELRTELLAQNKELNGIRNELRRQNEEIEKLVEILLSTAEMLNRRLNEPTLPRS
jgi:predicted  nucleic acid-binding Zn-ribbon protein